MADLLKVKNNVSKMVSMGAPESDIDSYIKAEGTTVEQIKSFKQQPESMKSLGVGGYIKEHPYKTLLDPAAKTITGKSLTEQSQSSSVFSKPPSNPLEFIGEFGAGLTRDISAYGADMVSTPANLAILGLGQLKGVQQIGKTIAGKVKQGVTAPYRYAKDLITRPEIATQEAKAAKFALGRKTDIAVKDIGRKSALKQSVKEKGYESVKQGYDELSGTLKKSITKEAHKESLNLQKELPELFRKKSTEYGSKLEALTKGKNITVSGDDVVSSIEDSLVQKGVLRFDPEVGKIVTARSPLTSAEKEIYGLYEGTLKQLSDNPGARIAIEDIMRVQKFSQPKFGKTWTSDDILRSNFSEKMSNFIDDSVEGIKGLKREFRPYLEWKKQAIKELKPFSGKFETGTSSKLISKIGSKELRPDEASLLSELEKQLGRSVGGKVKTFQKGLQSIETKQVAIKTEAKQVLSKLKEDASDTVFKLRQKQKFAQKDIDDAVDALVKKYRYKRIKAGIGAGVVFTAVTGGNLLKYFFRREIYSGLHGGL